MLLPDTLVMKPDIIINIFDENGAAIVSKCVPIQELTFRWDSCRTLLHQFIPQAIGMVGVENTFEVTVDGGKCLTGINFDIIAI
jgi:hypothetical protein